MDIKSKVAIVTGASSGIGAATARLLWQRGASVVLAARREDRLREMESEIAGSLAIVTDVTRAADIDNLVAKTIERFGRVDILVNNAGQGLHVPVEQITVPDYQAIMELNVFGPLLAMQAVIPHMRRQGAGTIVNISSMTTKMELPGVAAYASSKCALNMLSQIARRELASSHIDVTLIYPYITETEFHLKLRAQADSAIPRGAMPPGHSAEFVAGYILHSIQTGETEIQLRPGMPEARV